MIDVFLNEKYIGEVANAKTFMENVKAERRGGKLPATMNIYYDEKSNEIYLDSSKGRARRPLIVVENGKSLLTDDHYEKLKKNELKWSDLLKQGIIEYIDAAEEENIYVALKEEDITKEHTHLEIDPIVILGLTTSLVPFSNFVQSSRLNRGQKTQKQSLGLYLANYHLRIDTDVNILHYPQAPIVRSFMHDVSKYNEHPSGQNVVVALMSYHGYNMQDSLIINKASIERGLARSTFFRPYSSEELRYQGGLVDEIGVPDKDVKGYRSEEDYRHLEDDGIIYPEAKVDMEQVLIGKTSPPRFLGDMEEFTLAANTRREASTTIRHGERGVVDNIIITENEEGNKLVVVKVRDQRIPEVGDKFATRHGQKGVIGAIVPSTDMPFTASGLIPDIIFSPHSVPSRMSISHLMELLGGKVGALSGRTIDATTFAGEKEEDLRKELLSLGFKENGTEKLYNGITGEEYEATIFVGNQYYMKLKYMVANKLHARASGRIQLLTRQPIEGRAKGGGMRLGEMEKDCFVAHGASLLLKERFDSDKTRLHVCESCGLFAVSDDYKGKKFCQRCGNNVEITTIELSYAFKLLLDELKSLGFYPKLKLKSKYLD
ncbi:MAG: DNA-directed RNA polymerase subunit B [Candidatus Nanoarchaeia archaeon]|nr:DNA-directed RNA polymerase subunit B [Candidatus Nanoarchaeia archaeon]